MNDIYVVSEVNTYYIRAKCENSAGWGAWSTYITVATEGTIQPPDSGVPTVPLNFTLVSDDIDTNVAGKELVANWERPTSNFLTIFWYSLQIHTSATFPDHSVISSGATGTVIRGQDTLSDAGATFTSANLAQVLMIHTATPMTDANRLDCGTITEIVDSNTIRVNGKLKSSGTANLNWRIVVPDWAQVYRQYEIPTKILDPTVGDVTKFRKIIYGLPQGVYYGRVRASNQIGAGAVTASSAARTVDGFKQGDFSSALSTKVDNGEAANTGTVQYRGDIAPNGTFGSSGTFTKDHLHNVDASVDLVLTFQYTQSTYPAGGFYIYFNNTGAAIAVTDAAYAIEAVTTGGAQTYTIKILGVNPVNYYSFGVAAFALTKSGRTSAGLQSPSNWANFQPATVADYTGSISGETATIVKDGAANGKVAFDQTVQFRGNLPPTNAVTGYTGGGNWDLFAGGVSLMNFVYSYTQGANIATHFALYLKYGGGTISVTDPHVLVNAIEGTTKTIKMHFAIPHKGTWRFGMGAVAVCKSGAIYNTTIVQSSDQVLSSSNIIGVSGEGTLITGDPITLGGGGEVINLYGAKTFNSFDMHTNDPVILIPRRTTKTAANDGEWYWYNPAGGTQYGYMLYDGTTRVLFATKTGEHKHTDLVDPGDTDAVDPGDTNSTDPGDTNEHNHGTIESSSADGSVGYHVHDVSVGSHAHTMPSHIHTMPTHYHPMGTHDHTIDLDDMVRCFLNP
jgi:hypothetical protein